MHSFELSIKNYDIESNIASSERQRPITRGENAAAESNGFDRPPGGGVFNDDESGLITSDSDFDQAEKAAAGNMALPQQQTHNLVNADSNAANVRRDVSKTFKKMLTSNHNRCIATSEKNIYGDETSTKWGGSQRP